MNSGRQKTRLNVRSTVVLSYFKQKKKKTKKTPVNEIDLLSPQPKPTNQNCIEIAAC